MSDPLSFVQSWIDHGGNPLLVTVISLVIVMGVFLPLSKKLPTWLTGLVLVVVLLFGGIGIYLSTMFAPDPWNKSIRKTYYGYYGDMQMDGTTEIKDETLDLEFAATGPQLRGTVSGPVSADGKLIRRTWTFSGFQNRGAIALSFVTLADINTPSPNGIGDYLIEERSGGEYTGTAVYWDCGLRSMVQCPYAMLAGQIDVRTAKGRWPKLFSQGCTIIDLTPDTAASVASASGLSCGGR